MSTEITKMFIQVVKMFIQEFKAKKEAIAIRLKNALSL